ncbi:flagellar biosynthetic protein FliO [Halobacillus salinus]|uniref:flagellar biosynthetic protein FliO n=1 Tax=Halobacillus salinus TaxID=192814 RepID=UPI0009A7567F|nr:flagellar biosynthetic protein FliO [Halobacillus salinus]
MSRTAKIILLIMTTCLLSPAVTYASPTVIECSNNPELEGCASFAPAGDSKESPADGEAENMTGSDASLVGTIIKLIFVLILILGLIYGLLKFFNKKNKLFSRNRTMENLGGMNLAPNRSVQAVRIGEQVFILGVGDDVQLVTEVTDENTKTSLLDREQLGQAQPFKVGRIMDKFRQTEKSNDQTASSSTVQFQKLFENQLNEMKQKTKKVRRQKQEGSDDE